MFSTFRLLEGGRNHFLATESPVEMLDAARLQKALDGAGKPAVAPCAAPCAPLRTGWHRGDPGEAEQGRVEAVCPPLRPIRSPPPVRSAPKAPTQPVCTPPQRENQAFDFETR